MKPTAPNLYQFLGWNTQGDIGPYTCYTARDKGLVIFAKAPPRVPPSRMQRENRSKFAAIGWLWQRTTAASRAAWLEIARRARLRITGFNLWTYFLMTGDTATLRTLELNTGIKLDKPTYTLR